MVLMKKLKVSVYSVGRSDLDRYIPFLYDLKQNKKISLSIYLGKAHFLKKFGFTYKEFLKKGFSIKPRKYLGTFSDNEKAIAQNIAEETKYLNENFNKDKPNFLILLGDRYEILAGACASLGYNIPIIHLFGGAVTEGAIDEQIRHAITKISHLHFVAHKKYKERLISMGEEPWRIKVIGIPVLKIMKNYKTINKRKLSKIIKIDITKPTALVTFHPVTLEASKTNFYMNNLLSSIKSSNLQAIFSYPNMDLGHQKIISKIKKFVKKNNKKYTIIKNASGLLYTNLLRSAQVMVGNTSSGIVEAASFNIPVVNIGDRQKGKIIPAHVINVGYSIKNIKTGIKKSQSKIFLKNIKNMKNPYEISSFKEKFSNFLLKTSSSKTLIKKKFFEVKIK